MSSARKSGQKLIIDLVPGTMWGKNVRAVVSIEVWDTLRWNFGATWAKPYFPRFRISDGHNIRSNAACGGCGVLARSDIQPPTDNKRLSAGVRRLSFSGDPQ